MSDVPDPTPDDDELPLESWAVGMHPKDRQYVREFLVDLNALQAMMRCGHTEKSAKAHCSRQTRRPVIAKAIALAMHERAEALGITAKTVLGEAFRSYALCIADKQYAAAARFLEMVGKHVDVRAFRDRFMPGALDDEPDDDIERTEKMKNLSVEELEHLARIERKLAGVPEPTAQASPIRH